MPEFVDTDTGATRGTGPVGFSGALLPYLKAQNLSGLLEVSAGARARPGRQPGPAGADAASLLRTHAAAVRASLARWPLRLQPDRPAANPLETAMPIDPTRLKRTPPAGLPRHGRCHGDPAAGPGTGRCQDRAGRAGQLLAEHGARVDLAEESWKKLLNVDPQNADAMYGMSQVELARGNADAARGWTTKLRAGHPGDSRAAATAQGSGTPMTDVQRARAAAQAGRTAEAVQIFRGIFAGRPPPDPLALEYYQLLGGTPQGWGRRPQGPRADGQGPSRQPAGPAGAGAVAGPTGSRAGAPASPPWPSCRSSPARSAAAPAPPGGRR